MTERFPPIEPYETGTLNVGEGHTLAYECSGNPHGQPALFLHGGPGGGASPGQRRYFDPEKYRILLFDQRGCGKSRPLAEAPDANLAHNTTQHLIRDIEALRLHLSVDEWVVVGISWGTTLGLAYAAAHPERVAGLVLALVSATSKREVAWITEDVGRIFPEAWDRFREGVPERLRARPIVAAYAELLFDPDPSVQSAAAEHWCAWEDAHVSLSPGHARSAMFDDPAFRLRFARLVTHYWMHAGFLPDDFVARVGTRLEGIPGVLIHGRYDVSGPLETAWRISQSWRTSRLVVLDDTGHGGMGSFPAAIIDALARIARNPRRG